MPKSAKTKLSPSGRTASSTKTKLNPSGRTASSTKTKLSPSGRTALPPEKQTDLVSERDDEPLLDEDADEDDDIELEEVNFEKESTKHEFNPELQREVVFVAPEDRMTSNIISKYEFARVLAVRAQQIERDNIVFTSIDGLIDAAEMAKKEIIDKKCPLAIVRRLNDSQAELWPVNELMLLEE
jgi:DNA-directed RNA polymerase subunit K/omega